jgi:hypothetical protein
MAFYVRDILRDNNFDIICIQETMAQDFSDAMIRSVDLSKRYLWDWYGSLFLGFKLDFFKWVLGPKGSIFLCMWFGIRGWRKNGVSLMYMDLLRRTKKRIFLERWHPIVLSGRTPT